MHFRFGKIFHKHSVFSLSSCSISYLIHSDRIQMTTFMVKKKRKPQISQYVNLQKEENPPAHWQVCFTKLWCRLCILCPQVNLFVNVRRIFFVLQVCQPSCFLLAPDAAERCKDKNFPADSQHVTQNDPSLFSISIKYLGLLPGARSGNKQRDGK